MHATIVFEAIFNLATDIIAQWQRANNRRQCSQIQYFLFFPLSPVVVMLVVKTPVGALILLGVDACTCAGGAVTTRR